ncbi:MAG: Rho GTPase-activating protein [archaeon]|nr:Rho GTPase-activating protein [archaeon]
MTANGIPAPEERIFAIRQTIDRLPLGNRHVMAQLMLFLKEVASFSDSNKMTESNLAVIFAPTLLRPKVESIDMVFGNVTNSNELFTTLITDAERIFSKEPMLTAEEEDSLSKSEYSQVFGQVLKTGTIKLASNFLADLNNNVTTSTEQRRRSSTSAPGAAPTPHWMSIYDTADLASLPPALAAAPLPLPLSPAKPTSQSAYPGVSPGLNARPPRPSLLQRHPPLQALVASVSSPSASPFSSPPISVCSVVASHSPSPPSGSPNPLFSFSEAALPPPMLPASLPPLSASSPFTLPDPDPPTERAPSPPSPPTSHTTTTPTTPVLLKPPGLSSIAAAPLPPPISSSSSPSVSLPVTPSPPFPVTPTASQSSSLAASSPVASSSPPVVSSPLSSSSPTPASASAEKPQPTIDQLLALILRGQMPYVQKYLLSQPPDDRVRIKDALYARLAQLRQTPQP